MQECAPGLDEAGVYHTFLLPLRLQKYVHRHFPLPFGLRLLMMGFTGVNYAQNDYSAYVIAI